MSAGFYVPACGYPAADNLFVAGSDGFTPVIPIGRIPATTQAQVASTENQRNGSQHKPAPDHRRPAWMKRVMHMGGGIYT
ncbi:MAG: hypothetical protein IPN76_30955 [Saprospiraceae bacterium]|nr:hypothetical protein [Saprospiraceae bacterium]